MDSLVVSNIRQRPLRSAISILGVALGVALVMLFTGLAHGMSDDLQKRSSNVSAELIFTRPGSIQITGSSANVSTVAGIASPITFAVLRFMTSSNLVGCSTGKSPGFSPLRMRSI